MTIETAAGAVPPTDPDSAERAYLRRRASDEIGRAGVAQQRVARLPHDAMARAYCTRCRAIADPRECAGCTLRPLCLTLGNSHRAGALFGQPSYDAIAPETSLSLRPRTSGKLRISSAVRAS